MNHYPFHVGDYIKSTVHLTNEEDLTYRRMIDFYYDTERPIPLETQTVSKRLRLDNQTVSRILAEFFFEQDDGWHNKRCDEEITWYQQKCARNREVGKLGGRPKKTQVVSRKKRLETVSNPNQNQNQNQNQEPLNIGPSTLRGNGSDPTPVVEKIPLNDGTEYDVHQSFVAELDRLYPAVDVPGTLRQIRGWCITNPSRRKTVRGVNAFINRWLSKEQDKHG